MLLANGILSLLTSGEDVSGVTNVLRLLGPVGRVVHALMTNDTEILRFGPVLAR